MQPFYDTGPQSYFSSQTNSSATLVLSKTVTAAIVTVISHLDLESKLFSLLKPLW